MADHALPRPKNISNPRPRFRFKEPGSAITHLIGAVLSVCSMPFLLHYGAGKGASPVQMAAFTVFLLSMTALYSASTIYHSLDLPGGRNRVLKKLDHMMIFVLIAGTYTPVCLTVLAGYGGEALLMKVWAVALGGILLKFLWVTHPKWLSSVLYIGMGWLCLTEFPNILELMDQTGFWWLLLGGILYTIGGVVYALKLDKLNRLHPNFGSHEIFHLFVLAGSACHYVTMFYLL